MRRSSTAQTKSFQKPKKLKHGIYLWLPVLLYPNYLKTLDFSGRIKGFRQDKLEKAWLFSFRYNLTSHKFFWASPFGSFTSLPLLRDNGMKGHSHSVQVYFVLKALWSSRRAGSKGIYASLNCIDVRTTMPSPIYHAFSNLPCLLQFTLPKSFYPPAEVECLEVVWV